MRIKKTSETRPLTGSVVNEYNTSDKNAYSCDYINDRNTYSTDEKLTGEYWIDNKPIYSRVLTSNTPQTFSSRTSSITLGTVQNIDTITDLRTYCSTGGATDYIQSYMNNMTMSANTFNINNINNYYVSYRKSTGTINLNRQSGSTLPTTTTLDYYVCIIKYTKTTD